MFFRVRACKLEIAGAKQSVHAGPDAEHLTSLSGASLSIKWDV